jgi:hypothetical protein
LASWPVLALEPRGDLLGRLGEVGGHGDLDLGGQRLAGERGQGEKGEEKL